eukprot:576513-Alexandrium_andersonii.AAC.1
MALQPRRWVAARTRALPTAASLPAPASGASVALEPPRLGLCSGHPPGEAATRLRAGRTVAVLSRLLDASLLTASRADVAEAVLRPAKG